MRTNFDGKNYEQNYKKNRKLREKLWTSRLLPLLSSALPGGLLIAYRVVLSQAPVRSEAGTTPAYGVEREKRESKRGEEKVSP